MDEPNDFDIVKHTYTVGDLVSFTGYHYSPDYKYIDEDSYELGIILRVMERTFYQPVYVVFWFKLASSTEVIHDHLTKVVRN